MITPILVFIAFFILAVLTRTKTYFILATCAYLNFIVDKFTSENDLYLMVIYSAIDFITCVTILVFGDILKVYQGTILLLMIFAHFLMEMALVHDNVYLIESDIYVYTVSVLIILQMIGARYGVDNNNPLPWRNYHNYKINNLGLFNR
jgi:hypothetical protein